MSTQKKRVPGILRKHATGAEKETTDHKDLLVFGYASKIFRDDAKALDLERGHHLLKFDSKACSLRIDRYDVRGMLSDVSLYEAPPGGFGDRLEHLDEAERKAEELCEQERYYSLYNHEMEEEHYQDSATSASEPGAMTNFNQIGYNYNENKTISNSTEEIIGTESKPDDYDPFITPAGFDIPATIVLPNSMKEHAVIEKTAIFIASQGLQMEILLKAKQSNNPQFDFLNHDNSLHAYYRHMLDAIKRNEYPLNKDNVDNNTNVDKVDETAENNATQYVVPIVKYKPDADCVYYQLMSKLGVIKENTPQSETPDTIVSTLQNTSVAGPQAVSSSLRGLMENYDSNTDSEDGKSDVDEPITPPRDPAVQHIIDKTAAYVSKNGDEFEEILRMKNDPRFEFLNQQSSYYSYYVSQLKPSIRKTKQNIVRASPITKVPAPVSFSIKVKEENHKAVTKTIIEASDDDESQVQNDAEPEKKNITVLVTTKPITENLEEKLRENKLRDKLAAAAREKLGNLSKEKQLQNERKKRALAFLSKIKQSGALPERTMMNQASEKASDSEESVHSIPDAQISSDEEKRSERKHTSRKHKSKKSSRKSSKKRHRSRSRSRERKKRKKCSKSD